MNPNTKRIAKNTIVLYFRHILTTLINLYAVRFKLQILGIEDYGIYNIAAGIVVLFAFLNTAMTSSTQRFLNFSLGQEDTEQTRNVFSISFLIHILIAVLFIIFSQTAGLWFFKNMLSIPGDRQTAAFLVYQFSIAAAAISILKVPYKAIIIAYEKMSFLAFIETIEVLLKLGILFLLKIFIFDQLILYSIFLAITAVIIFITLKIYCNKTFEGARFRFYKDKLLFKQLAAFSGWSVFGSIANICVSQGINILLNIFHGVITNAAFGIATQVNSAVYRFVKNFQTAFNPQIVKSYSAKDYDYFMKLIFKTSKTSFFLLFFFVLPLYLNAGFVLQIWLKEVPEYTVMFTRLILLYLLFEALAGPLWMSIQATGDIKKYQLIESCFKISNMPLSFLLLYLGFSPIWVLINKLGINILTFIWRLGFLSKKINLPVKSFLFEVIFPVTIIAGISCLITIFFHNISFVNFSDWTTLILSCIVSTLSIFFLIYFVGITAHEKASLKNWVKTKLVKK